MADIVRRNIVKRPVTLRVKGLALITVTQGHTCTEKLLNCYVLYLTLLLKVRRLFQESPYHFSQESNVDIMDGPDEGLFAWITVNFLLGTKISLCFCVLIN